MKNTVSLCDVTHIRHCSPWLFLLIFIFFISVDEVDGSSLTGPFPEFLWI